MKVLWYNTWSYPFVTSNNHINKVVSYVLKAAELYRPDVIILGELFDERTRDAYKARLHQGLPTWRLLNYGQDTAWLGQQSGGLFAMYRPNGIQLIDARYHILSHAGMQDRLSAKGVLGLKFTNDKEPLWICASHLQDPDAGLPRLCEPNTRRQFAELLDTVEAWCAEEQGVVIGDFNIPPSATVLQRSQASLPVTVLHPGEATHLTSQETLDYGLNFCRAGTPVSIEVVNAGINPSDHKGIVVSVGGINETTDVHTKAIDSPSDAPFICFAMLCIYIFLLCPYFS